MLSLDDFHDVQWEGLAHLHIHPYCGLFYDAGLGKTVVGLTYLKQRIEMGVSRRALVVAPIRVAIQTWPNEIDEWEHLAGTPYQLIRAEDDDLEVKQAYQDFYSRAREGRLTEIEVEAYVELSIQYQRRTWEEFWTAGLSPIFTSSREEDEFLTQAIFNAEDAMTGRGLSTQEAARAAGTLTTQHKDRIRRRQALSDAPLHFINREALQWLVDYHRERKEGWPYDDMIYDESSDLGDHNTQRFKATKAIRPYLKSFIQMTATPAAEGYHKLFSQVALMDTGERFGLHITPWREKHFIYNSRTFSYKLKKGHDKVISSQIADICLVAKAEDHLPPVATGWANLTRKIELGPELREIERDFIESRILQINPKDRTKLPDDPDEYIEADNAASLSQKLLQFCSGAVYNKDKKAVLVHDHKIEELRQLIDELHGEPIAVAYWWQSSLVRLRKAFPKIQVMDRKGSQVPEWNKGKISLLALHPQGSEFGIQLQKGPGHDLAIFDIFWSYEKWYQIHKRFARQGQTRPVRSWPFVVRGSADEIAVKRLQSKEDAQNALFRYIMKIRQGVENAQTSPRTALAAAFD